MSRLRLNIEISLDGFGAAERRLVQGRAIEAPGVTHLTYRVLK